MGFTVGIVGITGKFAKRLVFHLLKQPDVSIRGYCRDCSKVPEEISSSRVSLIQGDAFSTNMIKAFAKGCDVIVCCYLGDDKLMVDGQKLLIDACDEFELKLGELFPKDPMIHVKAYIETKKVEGVHILIGGYMEPIFSPFFNIYDPQSQTLRFWGSGDEVMEGTTYDNAAEFTAAVAMDRKTTGVVKYLGGRTTIKELAQSFERIYGIKPTLESNGSLEDLYKIMHDKRAKEPANIYSYMLLFFYYYWVLMVKHCWEMI